MPNPTRPTRTPKELLVEMRRAEALEHSLAQEALEMERQHGKAAPRAREARARHANAQVDRDAKRKAFTDGQYAWEAYHAGEERERQEEERKGHHAILREVHKNNPDFLRSLGVEPLPEDDVVTYPPEAKEA
jgi:hypothetical protein